MARASLDFLIRETEAEYRAKAKTHLTSHALADFRRCPLFYWKKQQGLVPDEDRPAYLVGRAAHALILEGIETFEGRYAVGGPINPKTGQPFGANTKAWAEWAAGIGKDVLTDEQYALVTSMAVSVEAHPVAYELLADGLAEGVVRADYRSRPCQARLDFFNPQHGIIDLKTCDDLTWFEADGAVRLFAHRIPSAVWGLAGDSHRHDSAADLRQVAAADDDLVLLHGLHLSACALHADRLPAVDGDVAELGQHVVHAVPAAQELGQLLGEPADAAVHGVVVGGRILRRQQCRHCGRRVTTYESAE